MPPLWVRDPGEISATATLHGYADRWMAMRIHITVSAMMEGS
jgi:hypothetical protein